MTAPAIERLPGLVRRLAAETDWPERVSKVRDPAVDNVGCTAPPL